MSDSVQMPALGESVSEGTVTRWLKQVGERVEVDEPLLEVSTDKVDTEIPSPVAGVLEKILVGEDETVAVGTELAVIGTGASEGASDDGAGDQSQSQGESQGEAQGGSQDEPQGGSQESGGEEAAPRPEPTAPQDTAPAEAPSTDTEQPAAAPSAQASSADGEGTKVQMPA